MPEPVMQKDSSQSSQKSPQGSQQSIFLYTVVALGLALFIRFFIAAPYVVSGASMEPNFDNWHYLIVDRLSIRFGDPQRGEVIVFDLPTEASRSLIKRVIGLPGETVVLNDEHVTIINEAHPEGFALQEPYLNPENISPYGNMRVELGPDQFFVLGDNRKVSADSRLWGTLPRDKIVGRAILRLYPLNQMGILPADATGINK